MKKATSFFLIVAVALLLLSGCAKFRRMYRAMNDTPKDESAQITYDYGSQENSSIIKSEEELNKEIRKEAMTAHIECAHETAMTTAWDSDDFMYVMTTVRNQCSDIENKIFYTYPPSVRLKMVFFISNVFRDAAENSAALALTILKDKNKYKKLFFDCALSKTITRVSEKNALPDAGAIRRIIAEDLASCYDSILVPYIDKTENQYSIERKNSIIEASVQPQLNTLIRLLEEALEIQKSQKKKKQTPKQEEYDNEVPPIMAI